MPSLGIGRLTTNPKENTSDAFITPLPVCPSGLRHMAFSIAYGVSRSFSDLDDVKIAQGYVANCLLAFLLTALVNQNVIWFNICQGRLIS